MTEDVVTPMTRTNNPKLDELIGKKIYCLGDQGWVMLVDYMGSDAAIVQAARTSYGKGTKKLSEDEGLIRYLMRNRHCYDAETEVLTDRGFVPWPNVEPNMRLGIWDPVLESLVYEKPTYLTRDPYKGPMYRVNHGGVDLLVTPNHKMWASVIEYDRDEKKNKWPSYNLIPASDLGDRPMVRYSKLAPFHGAADFHPDKIGLPLCDDPRAALRLIGFFIGDGSIGSRNTITFNLRRKRKKDYLRALVAELGNGWKLHENLAMSVMAPNIGKLFDIFYDNKQKAIPDFLRELNAEDSIALLDGLKNSDGSIKRGAWSYSTSVHAVAEAVQHIALHAGCAAHIYEPCGEKGVWRVMFLSRMTRPVINQSRRNTSMENYDGKVFCAKTRTGILVVRRNGKIVLSGNTTPFEMCELKLLVYVPMDAWRQWIRHRTACLSGDTVLQFDLPGGIKHRGTQLYKLSVKDVFDRFQGTENTQRPDKQRNPFHRRERVQNMNLRCLNEETGEVTHTQVVDIWESGEKDVYRIHLASGASAKMSASHLCLTNMGWLPLKQIVGLPFSGETDGSPIMGRGIEGIVATTKLGSRIEQIVCVESCGEEMTYDLEVVGPHHNFSANGMIVHNSVNEYSTRYSIAIDEAAITSWMDWRAQSKKNKQGSDTVAGDMEWPEGFLEQEDLPENYQAAIGAGMTPGEYLSHREQEFLSIAREVYEERLEFGIAREQARKDLPLSTFTQAYWKIDLHNLLHFLGLRRNPHAQKEIRDYAVTIGNVFVKEWCPLAWQAYLDYRENALYLSRMEVQLLQIIAAGGQLHQILEAAESFGWLKRGTSGKLLKNRERSECEAKLVRLGFQIPWSNTDG